MYRLTVSLLALLFLSGTIRCSARAQAIQEPQQNSAPAQTSSSPSAAQQPPGADKKVWTNEDLNDLHDRAANSTAGGANVKPAKPGQKAATQAKDAKWYRDQIVKLQAKIPPLEDKIHQLQAGLNGETVNSVRTYGAVRADDWRDQLGRLQKQRDDISAKIAALEDEARHGGVPPNALP
jgi:hypothetical protein